MESQAGGRGRVMSYVIAAIAIDDFGAGPQGAKETLAMALEPLGAARVLRVEVVEEEQIKMGGGRI